MFMPKCPILVLANGLVDGLGERILAQSQQDREACGFLVGAIESREVKVQKAIIATNLSEMPDQFAISSAEYQLMSETLGPSERFVGLFHTHRKDAHPSPYDIEQMNMHPLIWLIIAGLGMNTGKGVVLGAFIAGAKELINVPIRVDD